MASQVAANFLRGCETLVWVFPSTARDAGAVVLADCFIEEHACLYA